MRDCIVAAGISMPEQVILTGGGAKSPLWRQILADVLGCSITVDDSGNHGLWGAALLGMAAAGHTPSTKPTSKVKNLIYIPDPKANSLYNKCFQRYCDAKAAMAKVIEKNQY